MIISNEFWHLLDQFLLKSHVLAGMIGLIVAPLAMAVTKGGVWHRRFGKLFFWMMTWILLSVIGLAFFRFSFFLTIIAILSFYAAFTGYRVLYHKNPQKGDGPTAIDWAGSIIALVSGVGMFAVGIASLAMPGSMGLVPYGVGSVLGIVFGLNLAASAIFDLRRFVKPSTDRSQWLYDHINRMSSAFIAMLTAFLVQQGSRFMPADWAWVLWVAPGVIGGTLIARYISQFRARKQHTLVKAGA